MKTGTYLAATGLLLSIGYFSVKHRATQGRPADFRDAMTSDPSAGALDSLGIFAGDTVTAAPAPDAFASIAGTVELDALKDNIVKTLMANPKDTKKAEKK